MAFDIRVQNLLEKKNGLTDHGVATGVKKPSLTDQGMATGVTKFRMGSGGLNLKEKLESVTDADGTVFTLTRVCHILKHSKSPRWYY